MKYKTFNELGISFQQTLGCHTCTGLSCHNNVEHKNGTEYNVHISTPYANSNIFNITATANSLTSSTNDIIENLLTEEQAVKLLCDNFNWFKCF